MKKREWFALALLLIAGAAWAQTPAPALEEEIGMIAYLINKFFAGGPLMYVLLGFSILAVGFMMERIVVLAIESLKLTPAKFIAAMQRIFAQPGKTPEQKVDELAAYSEKKKGVTAVVMLDGLDKWRMARKLKLPALEMKAWIQMALDAKAASATPVLLTRVAGIANISSVSTLTGLFGTVQGMIQSFDKMAASAGAAKPDELAGGISVALITTFGGLAVAIPTLLLYWVMKGWIDGRIMEIEEAGLLLTDELIMLSESDRLA